MLGLEHLSKRFGEKLAVDDVTFTVSAGEIFALIGPNSSGKTTIVRSIAGLLRVDDGTIIVDEKNIVESPKETKSVIGYIPDEPAAWNAMTGEEFLHFSGALYGLSPTERNERIAALLPRFSLDEMLHDRFDDLSRGNKQKFSIIAALLHRPKLLLVDEPIVGLDPESATVAKKLFREFVQSGGALLLVTHSLPVAEAIASRIGVMRKGKLIATGTLDELRKEAGLATNASLDEVYETLTNPR